ncbi:hypothetical protein EVJ50_07060 [Synechococcus sp. RSCCF101]|uniref:hypothetical protein n=1 Tax=Synechococcus sp. RSCCF101 TaxID=2511069 RepID=UPI001247B122|nr:hypothetical protein [Synechococcus sp. RSCCF101]QEY32033.1 hypothetical protein EVJ50_07060 [Synechococcus sp. RSCCF101]
MVIPGNQLGELDPAIVARRLTATWQEEILKRELMTMLTPVHVENHRQLFGRNAPNGKHFTATGSSDSLWRSCSGLSQEALLGEA